MTHELTQNEIYLNKRLKVLVEKPSSKTEFKIDHRILVATMMKNIESLGYIFSKKLANRLMSLSQDKVEQFYLEIVPILKKMRGAHKKFIPMYPNFPQQVLDMSQFELYWNAIVYYWGNQNPAGQNVGLPEYEVKERLPLAELHSHDVIDLGDKKDFDNIFTQLIGAKTSISESDKEIVSWFIQEYKDKIVDILPEEIAMKEQLALLIGSMLTHWIN